jgi:hypothetical protein
VAERRRPRRLRADEGSKRREMEWDDAVDRADAGCRFGSRKPFWKTALRSAGVRAGSNRAGAQVAFEQRIDGRVVRCAVEEELVPEQPLEAGTRFLRDALAGDIRLGDE